MLLLASLAANASATLLLEEPYGKLGWFAATGHAAVYLSGVCAETPVRLRPCVAGESGVVISRYNGVGGFDWVAIPLMPYLYAVEKQDDIPLFADPKMVSFLRDQYRRKHLEGVVPDLAGGETPSGNWYEVVGTAYDRTSYAFEIETSPKRDLAFIRAYNVSENRTHFNTMTSNCADFAKNVINFYYPKALHRGVVADIGMSTPKQMAKTMVKFSSRHSDLEFSRFVIPQIPGSETRSTAVHGVVESFFKSKKYIVPTAVVNPILAGCVAAVYVGTEEQDHFNPARGALVFNAGRELEPPVGAEDRRSYEIELKHIEEAEASASGNAPSEGTFVRRMENGTPRFDSKGHPVLRIQIGDQMVDAGVTRRNIFPKDSSLPSSSSFSSSQFARELLEARLREELRRGNPPKVSERDVERDWKLLQTLLNIPADQVVSGRAHALQAGSRVPGNQQ
jgi:hypothetical protein